MLNSATNDLLLSLQFIRQLESDVLTFKQVDDYSSAIVNDGNKAATSEIEQLKADMLFIEQQLDLTALQRSQRCLEREILTIKQYETVVLEDLLLEKLNMLEMRQQELVEDMRSIDMDIDRHASQLERISQLSCLNEAFHVWFEGPYGTINNFRLGYLRPNDDKMIAQTDAGLGQAALLVETVATTANIRFQEYGIYPMGSFAKIGKGRDKNTLHPLHIEQGPFTLYPRHNFNLALTGFLTCIQELCDFVQAYDPAITIPYIIEAKESKIGGIPFTFADDLETWTRSMKYMLTNVKWIVVWFSKHTQNMAVID